jgi:hypothetical protein
VGAGHYRRRADAELAWKLWSLASPNRFTGQHIITSRAIDTVRRVQPAQDDLWITGKDTYCESNGQVTRSVRVA